MATNTLEETVASAKDLPPEQAIPKLRDVILGKHPNDAESIKAKEQVPLVLLPCISPERLGSRRRIERISTILALYLPRTGYVPA